MDFTVEFYETAAGKCPVRDFLDGLKASDPDDFAAVLAGLAKLRNRQYHARLSRNQKSEYLAQRRKGRKGKTIPDFAFLAPWRE